MERKTQRFGLVLTPEEMASVRQLAEQEGVSVATAIRILIRTAARVGKVWPNKGEIQ